MTLSRRTRKTRIGAILALTVLAAVGMIAACDGSAAPSGHGATADEALFRAMLSHLEDEGRSVALTCLAIVPAGRDSSRAGELGSVDADVLAVLRREFPTVRDFSACERRDPASEGSARAYLEPGTGRPARLLSIEMSKNGALAGPHRLTVHEGPAAVWYWECPIGRTPKGLRAECTRVSTQG